MLRVTILGEELFNDETNEFSTIGDVILEFEHSLLSLSKWESIYKKPFLATVEKSPEEIADYFRCMILTPNVSEDVLNTLTQANINEINEYIGSTESATTFWEPKESKTKGRAEIVTSELVYYWMVSFNIPFECETWHLNRLFSLLRICTIKNSKEKKMSRSEIAARNRSLNEQRKAQLGTTG